MLAFLDSGARTNNQFNSLNPDEEWHADSGMMTYTIPNFTQAGTYALDNALFTQNSTGVCRLSGTEISFTPNIPEPSVPLLAGIAGTLALLRRKRNDTESTNTSAS
jgi:hypothetical protein